jgi:UDP-N-acetylglucosamine 4,6-dehydratase/5-epimerase
MTSHSGGTGGRCVLVTGGDGSLGRLLVARLRDAGSREVRIVSRRPPADPIGSTAACTIRYFGADVAVVGSIAPYLTGVDTVFHLAALKDVSQCEDDPIAAMRTNVFGTTNVLEAAVQANSVDKFVAVSSDKACEPVSVLGMTKALMERVITRVAKDTDMSLGSVRLGNVWGTKGSVLDRWSASVRAHRRFDVSDTEMTRFFLLPVAAIDVLMELASRSFRGEIIAPRMRAYRLGDLAEAFGDEHRASAQETGRRPGEKLHEDLVSTDEARTARADGHLYIVGRNAGGGVRPVTSIGAERVSISELRELIRPV